VFSASEIDFKSWIIVLIESTIESGKDLSFKLSTIF